MHGAKLFERCAQGPLARSSEWTPFQPMPTRTEDTIEEMEHKLAVEYGCKIKHSGLPRSSVRVPIGGKTAEFHVHTFILIGPEDTRTAFVWMFPDVQKLRNKPREVVTRIKSQEIDSAQAAVFQWFEEKFPGVA